MRDPFLNIVLPFLADELATRAGIEIIPCTCPPGGPCLGIEDEAEAEAVRTILIFGALNSDDDDSGSGPADQPSDEEDLDDDLDDEDLDDDFDAYDFMLTPEGIAEIEREQNRQEVAHLGKIVDNMVYIVGMHAALVQNKVGA